MFVKISRDLSQSVWKTALISAIASTWLSSPSGWMNSSWVILMYSSSDSVGNSSGSSLISNVFSTSFDNRENSKFSGFSRISFTTRWSFSSLPHANSDKYNYYIKKGKYIASGENFVSKLKKILDENENDNLIEFAVDSKVNSVPDKMVYVFQDDEYEKYVDKNASRFNYYNVLNTYILLANK